MRQENENKKVEELQNEDLFDSCSQDQAYASGSAAVGTISRKENTMAKKRAQDLWFVSLIFIWPTLCIIVGYFVCNINYVLLAFQKFIPHPELGNANGWFEFLPIDQLLVNFSTAWERIAESVNVGKVVRNSLLNYFVGLFCITPIQIYISFAIYKKVKGVQAYIIILYLPQIVASMVWVLIYKYMLSFVIPAITGNFYIPSLLTGAVQSLDVLVLMWVFIAWLNLGGAMMIITGMFARIEHEIVEAAQIDGCNLWNEFWHISFPHYWPVFSISIFTGVAGIFTGNPSLYEFYGPDAPEEVWTFGYYFFQLVVASYMDARQFYPEAAASGLLMTAVVVPIVLTTKYLVEKADKMEGSV